VTRVVLLAPLPLLLLLSCSPAPKTPSKQAPARADVSASSDEETECHPLTVYLPPGDICDGICCAEMSEAACEARHHVPDCLTTVVSDCAPKCNTP
jgi:hypothetical protein